MNRILAVSTVVGILFVGLAAVSLQLGDYNPEVNVEVLDGITAIANVSFLVIGFVGIFVAAIIVLLTVIATMGGR